MARPPKPFSFFGPCPPFGENISHQEKAEKMEEDKVLKFPTGAIRDASAQDEAWHLVPILGILRVAKTAAYGAAKYGIGNWLKGIPLSSCINRAIRHLYLFLLGDKSEDHLGHAAWNILAACHFEMVRPELADIVWQDPKDKRKVFQFYGDEIFNGIIEEKEENLPLIHHVVHQGSDREVCKVCSKISGVGYSVPEELWRQAVPEHLQNEVICLNCFVEFADQQSLAWDNEIQFWPVSLKTRQEIEI